VNRAYQIIPQVPDFDHPPVSKVDALGASDPSLPITREIPHVHEHLPACRSRDAEGRRTLSNTTVFLHATELARSEIYYNPGNPCKHKWNSYSDLLQPECFECSYVDARKVILRNRKVGWIEERGRKPLFGKIPLDK